jgi:hypothetical protein
MQNIIDDIFNSLDNVALIGLSQDIQKIETLEYLHSLPLRKAVSDSCIFQEELVDQESKLHIWYNVFHFHSTNEEIEIAKQNTLDLFNSLGIDLPQIEGLSYQLVNFNDVDTQNNINFTSDIAEVVKSFIEKADCMFFKWFQVFYDNTDLVNQTKVLVELERVLQEYSKNSPTVLELILSAEYSIANSLVAKVMADRDDFILREDTIEILEKQLQQFDLSKESQIITIYLKILIDNVVNTNNRNPAHSIFLVDIMATEGFNTVLSEEIIERFEDFVRKEDSAVSALPIEFFEKFESLLATSEVDKDKFPILALLGQAVIKGYYKVNFDTFESFEWLFNQDSSLQELAFKVICSYVSDAFKLDNPEHSFIESKINYLVQSEYKIPKALIEQIMQAYLQNQNYFASSLAVIVEEYYHKYKNLLETFAINLADLLKKSQVLSTSINDNCKSWPYLLNHIPPFSIFCKSYFLATPLSNQHIKDVSFLLLRLSEIKAALPADTSTIIATFLKDEDIYLKRAISKLYKQLNHNFILPQNTFEYLTEANLDLDHIITLKNAEKIKTQTKLILKNSDLSKYQKSQSWQDFFYNLLSADQDEFLMILKTLPKNLKFIFSYLNEETQDDFFWAIERIANYNLSLDAIDRDGYTILDVFLKQAPADWSKFIKRIYDDNSFFIEYDLSELLNKVKELNTKNTELGVQQDNPEILELLEKDSSGKNYYEKTFSDIQTLEANWIYNFVTSDEEKTEQKNTVYIYLKNEKILLKVNGKVHYLRVTEDDECLLSIKKSIENQEPISSNDIFYLSNKLGYYKDLKTWEQDDFIAWSKYIKSVDDSNIAQIITVLKQAAFNTVFEYKYYPRQTQIISVLSLYKSQNGRLAQVTTGEGKSVIISMFAALKFLAGHQVDIINSSKELAERDSQEQKPFYDILGIKSGNNNPGRQECYKDSVLYGDLSTYIGDDLRDIEFGTRLGRDFDIIIIDEVDNLLIDLQAMTVRLTSTTPGFYQLQQVLIQLWTIYPHMLKAFGEICDPHHEDLDLKRCIESLRENLNDYGSYDILSPSANREDIGVIIPNHLLGFTKNQMYNWVNSLINTLTRFVQDVDYNIGDHNETLTSSVARIRPVDFKNTGTIQHNMQWSDALYQFISLYHRISLTPETLVGLFMTYVSYVSKYKGNIYGLTGTLGNEVNTDFLAKAYDVDFITVPTFKEKKLVIYPQIINNDAEHWLTSIIDNLKARVINDLRPVLIIMLSIKQVNELYKTISKDSDFENFKILTYQFGEKAEREQIEGRNIDGKTIIIATNLAGRGTDIKITKEVEKSGGLHVILTYFPESARVMWQAFGRAARKGEYGSAQLIINNDISNQCNDLACLNEKRDSAELEKFIRDEACSLPHLLTQDWIFSKFRYLISNLYSPTGYFFTLNNTDEHGMLNNHLYLYDKNESIYFSLINSRNQVDRYRIEDELFTLDENLYVHIKKVIQDQRNYLSLNKQELELLHYIAATKGINSNKNNVLNEVDKAVEGIKKKCNGIHNLLNLITDECDLSQLLSANTIKYLEVYLPKAQPEAPQMNNSQYSILEYLKSNFLSWKKAPTLVKVDNFRYAIWKQYLEVFNHHPDLNQVKALWEMWLYEQREVFDDFVAQCRPKDPNQNAKLLESIRTELSEKFETFADEIKKKSEKISIFNAKTSFFNADRLLREKELLFNNPTLLINKAYLYSNIYQSEFYQVINPKRFDYTMLSQAINFASSAIALDRKLAFSAYQAHANIEFIKSSSEITNIKDQDNGNKIGEVVNILHSDLQSSNIGVQDLIIQTELSIINLLSHNARPAKPGDASINQLIARREFFIKYNESQWQLMHSIESNFQEGAELRGIRPDQLITNREYANEVDLKEGYESLLDKFQELSQVINTTSYKSLDFSKQKPLIRAEGLRLENEYNFQFVGAIFFDLKEKNDDWISKLFVSVAGVVQILAGIAVVGIGGPFSTSMGISMIMSGISDIMLVARALIDNTPIDMEQYLRGKAITYSVALITAGIARACQFNPTNLDGTKFVQSMNGHELFQYALGHFAVNTVIGIVVGNAAKNIAKNNDGDAEQDARAAADWLLHHYELELQNIFIADALDRYDILLELKRDANQVARRCGKLLGNVPSAISQGTLSSLGTLGVGPALLGTTAVALIGYAQYQEISEDFKGEYKNVILTHSHNARDYLSNNGGSAMLFRTSLEESWNVDQVTDAMDKLQGLGVIDYNYNMNYADCNKINRHDPENFPGITREDLFAECDSLYHQSQAYKENLRQHLVSVMKQAMTNTLQNEVFSPVMSHAAHLAYNDVSEKINGYFKDKKSAKEKQAAAKTELQKPEVVIKAQEEADAAKPDAAQDAGPKENKKDNKFNFLTNGATPGIIVEPLTMREFKPSKVDEPSIPDHGSCAESTPLDISPRLADFLRIHDIPIGVPLSAAQASKLRDIILYDNSDIFGGNYFDHEFANLNFNAGVMLNLIPGGIAIAKLGQQLAKGVVKNGKNIYSVYKAEGAAGAIKTIASEAKEAYSATKSFFAEFIDDSAKFFGLKPYVIKPHGVDPAAWSKTENIVKELHRDHYFKLPQEAIDKVPSNLFKSAKFADEGIGIKFNTGKADNIRIMKADPKAPFDSQKVDYVKLTRGGQVIGRDGKPILESATIKSPASEENAHISLQEWIKWKK